MTTTPDYEAERKAQTWICRCGKRFPNHLEAADHAMTHEKGKG